MTYKNKIIYLGLLFGLTLPIVSCIDPVAPSLNLNDSESLLVVDGQITNEAGPFKVKLTTSVPVNMMFSPNPVLNADVFIVDDQGNSFRLYGDNNGLYKTADTTLKGVPGNTYNLNITTTDGIEYTSSRVLMQDVPDIDNVYFEKVQHPRLENGLVFEDNWLNILLDTHDATDAIKYWLFKYEETWEVNLASDSIKVVHDKDYHSIFTYENLAPSDNKHCWVSKPSNSILIATTANNHTNELKGFHVQSLGPGEPKLRIRYSILVKQFSISHEFYNYWKQMMGVNENAGGIYEIIPAPVYGNITCSNGTKKALGYFSASSVKQKRLFIEFTEHNVETKRVNEGCYYFDYGVPPSVQHVDFGTDVLTGKKIYAFSDFCADCTSFGTNVKPSYW